MRLFAFMCKYRTQPFHQRKGNIPYGTERSAGLSRRDRAFSESLPDTIRPEILFSMMMYANDEASTEADAFLPKIKYHLTKTGGQKRVSATLRAIGALDFILQRAVDKLTELPGFAAMLSETRPDLADRQLARQPLTLKHAQAALSSWKNLRSTLLTHANLSRYEDILLTSRHLRSHKQ